MPLRRTGFKRKPPMHQPAVEREPRPLAKLTRPVSYAGTTTGPVAKHPMLQHEGYMAAVRLLGYCMLCRHECRPQFCHRDQTKGMGLKTDVREGWPGCADCHYMVGTSGKLAKEDRRALELRLGAQTREAVRAAGTWPKSLPDWIEAGGI
jgi:hypothetical protein